MTTRCNSPYSFIVPRVVKGAATQKPLYRYKWGQRFSFVEFREYLADGAC